MYWFRLDLTEYSILRFFPVRLVAAVLDGMGDGICR